MRIPAGTQRRIEGGKLAAAALCRQARTQAKLSSEHRAAAFDRDMDCAHCS
jgi:hypothetical protein